MFKKSKQKVNRGYTAARHGEGMWERDLRYNDTYNSHWTARYFKVDETAVSTGCKKPLPIEMSVSIQAAIEIFFFFFLNDECVKTHSYIHMETAKQYYVWFSLFVLVKPLSSPSNQMSI